MFQYHSRPEYPFPPVEVRLLLENEVPWWLQGIHRGLAGLWQETILVPLFTDHGLAHSLRIAESAAAMLEVGRHMERPLRPIERQVLAAGIYLHDIGMQCTDVEILESHNLRLGQGGLEYIDPTREEPISATSEPQHAALKLRSIHHQVSKEWLEKIWRNNSQGDDLSNAIRSILPDLHNAIGNLCLYHSKEDIRLCPQNVSEPRLRVQLLAAIVRLADELDTAHDRVNVRSALVQGMPPGSAQHFWLHYLTDLDHDEIRRGSIRPYLMLSAEERRWYEPVLRRRIVEDFRNKNDPILSVLARHGIVLRNETDGQTKDGQNRARLPDRVRERLDPVAYHLEQADKANGGVCSDALTDKVFTNGAAAQVDAAWQAYVQGLGSGGPGTHREVEWLVRLEYGRLLRFRGNWEAAAEQFERCVSFGQACAAQQAAALVERGSLDFERGKTKAGLEDVERAMEVLKREASRGPDHLLALVKTQKALGNMRREGSPQEQWRAQAHLDLALGMMEHLLQSGDPGYSVILSDCHRELGNVFANMGRLEEAQTHYGHALATLGQRAAEPDSCAHHLRGIIEYHLGKMSLRQGRLIEAREHLTTARSILDNYQNDVRKSFVADALAAAHSRLGEGEQAEQLFREALDARERAKHPHLEAYTRHAMAQHLLGTSDPARLDEAASYVEAAIEKWQTMVSTGGQAKFDLAGAHLTLGLINKARWDHRGDVSHRDTAEKEFSEAHDEYQRARNLDGQHRAIRERNLLRGAPDAPQYLCEEGEYQFHDWLRNALSEGKSAGPLKVVVGIGDDAAVVALEEGGDCASGVQIAVSTDAAPGSICRSSEADDGKYAAQFAVTQGVSDLIAMGAAPRAILLNLYLRRDVSLSYVEAVITGVRDVARTYGALVVGGDLKEREEQSVGCVALGSIPSGQRAIRRTGSEIGQVVAITLARRRAGEGLRKIGVRWAVDLLLARKASMGLVPELQSILDEYTTNDVKRELLYAPHKEMLAAAQTGKVAAAMDTSDGVMACLEILAREASAETHKDLGFVLEEELINGAIDDRVKEVASLLGVHCGQFMFNAGHDWEVVLTLREDDFPDVQRAVRDAGGALWPLGRVVEYADPDARSRLRREIGIRRSHDSAIRRVPLFTDEKFVSSAYEMRLAEWYELNLAGWLAGNATIRLRSKYEPIPEALRSIA